MTNGYEEMTRGNGSKWYLCDYCEQIAHCTVTEKEMINHVEVKHR